MPCSWATKLKLSPHTHSSFQRFGRLVTHPPNHPAPFPRYAFVGSSCQAFQEKKAYPSSVVSSPVPNYPPSSQADLTPAQCSRAAAQAVRLSAQNRAFGDALHVVNSLHAAASPYTSAMFHSIPGVAHRYISPRLSAHCFLHALVRSGKARQAARFSEMMLGQGLQLRSRTLRSIIEALCQTRFAQSNARFGPLAKSPTTYHTDGSHVLNLVSSRVADPSCRAAVRILEHARKYGHQRTQEMYDILIHACLVQGEIIVASLLFVLLVKEFVVRRPVPTSVPEDNSQESSRPNLAHDGAPSSPRVRRIPLQTLNLVVRNVDAVFAHNPRKEFDETRLRTSLQALANLAMLLEHDCFPSGQLSSLLRALYSCPKTDVKIWIIRGGGPKSVEAYPYFQRVLVKMIKSLKSSAETSFTTSLDARAYNALLYYALQHRLSPSLASTVLTHMVNRRQPPLRPSITTYNILLRSATLLRRPDLAQSLLGNLGRSFRAPAPASRTTSATAARATSSLPGPSDLRRSLVRLIEEPFQIPNRLLQGFSTLKPDIYTLTAYICHLVSTGNPNAVKDLLLGLFPELRTAYNSSLTLGERGQHKRTCFRRLMSYGPHFFAAALNALAKARQIGLAKRMWVLAHSSQRNSGSSRRKGRWWPTTIHAYTSMLQCYAAEANSFVGRGRAQNQGSFLHNRHSRTNASHGRTPGWRSRVQLFRSVAFGSRTPRGPTTEVCTPPYSLSTMPDARFFNAALDVFQSKRHLPLGAARKLVGAKHRVYRRSIDQLQALQEVEHGMALSGLVVPQKLQRVSGVVEQDDGLRVLDRSRYAFPHPSQRFDSCRLPVVKSHGLPLPRKGSKFKRVTRNHQPIPPR